MYVLDHSKIGIMGLNPARYMDVCPCLSVLYFPVNFRVLATGQSVLQGVLPTFLKRLTVSEFNFILEQAKGPNLRNAQT